MSGVSDNKVTIDIVAENSQLKARLAETEAALKKIQEPTSENEDGFFTGLKKGIHGIKQYTGALFGAIGVATAFYSIGRKIRDVLNLDQSKFVDVMERINSIDYSNAVAELAKFNNELKDLQNLQNLSDELGPVESVIALFKEDFRNLPERITAIAAATDSLRAKIASDNRKAEEITAKESKEAEKRRIQDNAVEILRLRAQSLDEVDQLEAERAAARVKRERQIQESANGGASQRELRSLREVQGAEEESFRKRIERARQEKEESQAKYEEEQALQLETIRERLHDEEMRRIEEQNRAREESLKRQLEIVKQIQDAQSAGFSLSGTYASAGAASAAFDGLAARTGRGNGRR